MSQVLFSVLILNNSEYHFLKSVAVRKMMFGREHLEAEKMDTAHVHLDSSPQVCPIPTAVRTKN